MAAKKVWVPTPKQKEALQLGSLLRTLACIRGQLGALNRQMYEAQVRDPSIDTMIGKAEESIASIERIVRQVSIFTAHRNKQEKEHENHG